MRPDLPTERYDLFSQVLHWLTAVAVTIGFILGPGDFGRLMRQGVDPATRSDIVWHESLGLLVLVLTLTRLVWVARRPQRPRFALPLWMDRSSRSVQIVLWFLLLALPITALLSLGSEGHPLTVLGGLRIDRMPLIEASGVGKLADWGDVHGWLGDVLIWLAGFHALAALYHQFVLKDGVLRAMLPGRR
ncbi:MAG: cytochrome b/b6 domain-containing protein [Rhizobacter sp.]|nr:cytochrome b/b6 domain-containing protein [Rhizobacter sp.]